MAKRFAPLGGEKPQPVKSVDHRASAKYVKPRIKPARRNGDVITFIVDADGNRTFKDVQRVTQAPARVIKPKAPKPAPQKQTPREVLREHGLTLNSVSADTRAALRRLNVVE